MNNTTSKKQPKPVAGILAAIIIVLIAVPYGMYFTWTSRGDIVDFSSKPQYGWGVESKTVAIEGTQVHLYDQQCFGFVRDTHYDPKTQSLFAHGVLTPPGPGAMP